MDGTIEYSKDTIDNILSPEIIHITSGDNRINIISGGYSVIGKLVIVNFRFSCSVANNLVTFSTNLPSPTTDTKQYIPANVIAIQRDVGSLDYGYKVAGTSNITVNITTANTEYALSCVYIKA